MSRQANNVSGHARVEQLLRTADAAPWADAPAGLRERVVRSLDGVQHPVRGESWSGRQAAALAACVAIALGGGGLGLLIGAAAWRNVPLRGTGFTLAPVAPDASAPADAPTVLLARAFDDLRPAGSSSLMSAMSAPMRSEAAGLASETRLAARTVLSRLPFVSME